MEIYPSKPRTLNLTPMCFCTPELRTPWCGKPGCEMPKQTHTIRTCTCVNCPERTGEDCTAPHHKPKTLAELQEEVEKQYGDFVIGVYQQLSPDKVFDAVVTFIKQQQAEAYVEGQNVHTTTVTRKSDWDYHQCDNCKEDVAQLVSYCPSCGLKITDGPLPAVKGEEE